MLSLFPMSNTKSAVERLHDDYRRQLDESKKAQEIFEDDDVRRIHTTHDDGC